ncbi:hypothetical protein [Pedobacter psychrophilus]|nr:hypothetical protein [Pedobacter psychrophilus]
MLPKEVIDFWYVFIIIFLLLILVSGILQFLQLENLIITNNHVILNQGIFRGKILFSIADISEIYYNDNEISSNLRDGTGMNTRTLHVYTNYRTTIVSKDNDKWTLNTLMPNDYKNFRFFYDQINLGVKDLKPKKLTFKEYWNNNQDGLKSILLNGFFLLFIYLIYLYFK